MACTARYEEEVVRLLYMFASIIIDHRYSPQNFLRQAAMQIPTLKLQALASTLFFFIGACHIWAGSVGVRPYTAGASRTVPNMFFSRAHR